MHCQYVSFCETIRDFSVHELLFFKQQLTWDCTQPIRAFGSFIAELENLTEPGCVKRI